MAADRKRRERLAVDTRKAVQMARLHLDYDFGDPRRAVEEAIVAAIKAEEFRRHVEAEAKAQEDAKGGES